MNVRASVNKVILPPISSRVKQNLYIARYGVDSTQVRAFVKIATMAGERQIFDIAGAAVLAGNNVFDLVWDGAVLLTKPTVLATVSGPAADKQPGSGIHC